MGAREKRQGRRRRRLMHGDTFYMNVYYETCQVFLYIYTLSDIGTQRALTGVHYTHTVVAISTCILTHTFLH